MALLEKVSVLKGNRRLQLDPGGENEKHNPVILRDVTNLSTKSHTTPCWVLYTRKKW